MPKILSERKAWLKLAEAFKRPRKTDAELASSIEPPLNINGICYAIKLLQRKQLISSETRESMSEKISDFCMLKDTSYPFGKYNEYGQPIEEVLQGDQKRVAYCLKKARELDRKS